MANEDPDGIPEQIRQNRPFFLVLGLAFAIAIGAFLYILFLDTDSRDVTRNAPPAATTPAMPAGEAAPEAAPAEGN
ncbi:hypothetical protein BDE18_2894 [Paracoccus pantotrophus]|uniref:Uncharacterized protein n=1 Tax=Paracoccus pantotrophus TaxID=82367 RepID=A0AAE6NSJ1_PARPN|nr:hypothetical protein [Paracoccus pantotrophus]QFG35691.1 hypothetical protein ESD82_05905 [Paracoccus pantotrophus]RKS44064.1 hypothetical protein BDE18_2894 [Paracoccus pantotrophus]